MGVKITISDIKQAYSLLKRKALKEYVRGNYLASWDALHRSVTLAQEFNWQYSDDDLEKLLQDIAIKWIPDVPECYSVDENKVVVLDSWCTSYVLVLQYIEALVSVNKQILYITSKDIHNTRHKNILDRLATYPNLRCLVKPFENRRMDEWSREVYNTILDFHPSKIIGHILPCAAFLPLMARLPKSIQIYRSNLDDQVFWLGRSIIDYVIEFRPFGVAVSQEKRKIKPEQQLYVPYYPIVDGNPFGGFPELPKDSVIFFSGGDFYKTLDPDYTYWNLVKRLLQDNPNAVLLFATKNGLRPQQEFLSSFVHDNHLEKQFYFIGFRPDIYEVFAHADIFMGTCPICGALTTQLAAFTHTPIMQYYLPGSYDDETEQGLDYNNPNLQITSPDIESFLAEAKRLVNDKEYRKQKAEMAYASTIKPEQFNKVFIDAITTNVAPCPSKHVDYAEVARRWLWPMEMGFVDELGYLEPMMKEYGLLKYMPLLWLKYNYRRIFEQKLFSLDWYRYKFARK